MKERDEKRGWTGCAVGAVIFLNPHYTKRAEAPCFIISGVEMRETKIAAIKG